MELEIILCQVSQSQKDKYRIFFSPLWLVDFIQLHKVSNVYAMSIEMKLCKRTKRLRAVGRARRKEGKGQGSGRMLSVHYILTQNL